METLLDALKNAILLLWNLDPKVLEYAGRSLITSISSTALASIIAIPAGVMLAEYRFPGRRLVVTIVNTLQGVPTVVIALLVYCFIKRTGPLGSLDMLFTVKGIILGETLLIIPLITGLTYAAVLRTDRHIRAQAMALGAGPVQTLVTILEESRVGILAAVIAGYGRVIGEIGIAMIIGGSADGFTRTLTTAIALNIDMGMFEVALALGILLLILSFTVNIMFQWLQGAAGARVDSR